MFAQSFKQLDVLNG